MAKVQEKEGDHLADAITIASTTIAVTAVWVPEIRAMLISRAIVAAPVAVPIAAVAVSTYAIGGVIAFATADPEDEGWYGAEALKEYYHDPIGSTADTATEYIVDPVASWVERRVVEATTAKNKFIARLPTKEEAIGYWKLGWGISSPWV